MKNLKKLAIFSCIILALLILFGIYRNNGNLSLRIDTNSTSNESSEHSNSPESQEKFNSSVADHTLAKVDRISVTFYDDSNTQKAFTWYTSKSDSDTNVIEILKDSGFNLSFDKAIQITALTGNATYAENDIWHKAIATDLEPDTTYFYRIGNPTENKWSDTFQFQTASNKAFTFIAVTDTQGATENDYAFSTNTLKNAVATVPDYKFILHSGDFVDDGNEEIQWSQMLNQASSLFTNTTLVPAAGNHDAKTNAFSDHFNLPIVANASTENGIFYSFDYGYTHFIVLNTNENSALCSDLSELQFDWLKTNIVQAKQNGAHWIIINMHKGMYTVGPHSSDEDIYGQHGLRSVLAPLFESMGVDLVIQGHDHYASCTKPLINNNVSEKGTIYLETGEAGVKTYPKNTALPQNYLSLFQFISPSDRTYAKYGDFAEINVSDHALIVTMYEVNKSQVGSPYLLQTITIKK